MTRSVGRWIARGVVVGLVCGALAAALVGCTTMDRQFAACLAADVAMAAPVPAVALGGAVTSLVRCR